MIKELLSRLESQDLTLFTAESCTGGYLGKVFTDPPGASASYWGGVVVYHNDAKKTLLSVKENTLYNYGAVSEEVLREMLLGALERYPIDIVLAVTGIAGPGGGSPEKPVGTVWLGIADRQGYIKLAKKYFSGNRGEIRDAVVQDMLSLLNELLNKTGLDSKRCKP